jgi:hypothetical protein
MTKHSRKLLFVAYLIVTLCTVVAFFHLSGPRPIEPQYYFTFKTRQPFIYRILLPMIMNHIGIDVSNCNTGLNFPIQSCGDIASLIIDDLALIISCMMIYATFIKIASHSDTSLGEPFIAIPIFIWMVIFTYVMVPNRNLYYPYDFSELMFFSLAAYVGACLHISYIVLPFLTLLSALNKETAFFVPIICVLYANTVGALRQRLLISAAASFVISFFTKYLCIWYIRIIIGRGFSGHLLLFENRILDNLSQLANPIAWMSWAAAFGGLYLLWFVPMDRTRILDRAVGLLACMWVGVIFIVGINRELRLLAPLILPVLLPTVMKIDSILFHREDEVAR